MQRDFADLVHAVVNLDRDVADAGQGVTDHALSAGEFKRILLRPFFFGLRRWLEAIGKGSVALILECTNVEGTGKGA